jgi:thioredoxin-like negative regulator of GroEL
MQIIKFGAEWCSACVALEPIIEELKVSNPSHEFVVKDVDSEEDGNAAIEYKIKSLPTVVFVNHRNEEIFRFVGPKSKKYIQDVIDELS